MRRLWKGEEEGVKCPSCKSKELFLNEESDHPGGIVCPLCKEEPWPGELDPLGPDRRTIL